MKNNKLYYSILITLFSVLGSSLVGYVFYQKAIFNYSTLTFQFISSGLIGGIFFCILEFKSIKVLLQSFVGIFVLTLFQIPESSLFIAYGIRNLLFLSGLVVSIVLYHRIAIKNNKIKIFIRSSILSLFYGVFNGIAGFLVFLINAKNGLPPSEFMYSLVLYGVLIGLGIGLGVDFLFQYKKRLFSWLKINVA